LVDANSQELKGLNFKLCVFRECGVKSMHICVYLILYFFSKNMKNSTTIIGC